MLSAWEGVDYPLRIAGDGPLRRMCDNAQSKFITCIGALDRGRVYAEMRRAAFLVLPSICYEMFPMSLVEAYANGLPVLTSKLGGLKSLLDDGVTGLSFEPGNVEDIRAKVRWAAAHPAKMLEMGRNARSKYEAHYTAEQNYANLMRIYAQAVAQKASR